MKRMIGKSIMIEKFINRGILSWYKPKLKIIKYYAVKVDPKEFLGIPKIK